MPNNTLDEREFELINIIGAEMASSQRDLSQKINLSLGATNMLIRRLISKGDFRDHVQDGESGRALFQCFRE